MKRLSGLVAIAAAVAAPTMASGQAAPAGPTPVSVTVTAGPAMPMGDLDNIFNTGFGIAGGVEFTPAMIPFQLRGELGYTRLGAETYRIPDGQGGEVSIKPKWNNLAVTVNAILGPTVPSTQIRPYAIAGIGFYNTSEGAEVRLDGFDASGSEDKASFGFNGGAGVRFRFVGFSTFVEARYHHILKGELEEMDIEDPDAPVRWRSAAYVPITFGITVGGR